VGRRKPSEHALTLSFLDPGKTIFLTDIIKAWPWRERRLPGGQFVGAQKLTNNKHKNTENNLNIQKM
jgi:hypothetical protein